MCYVKSVVTNYLSLQQELIFANKGFRFRLNNQRSSKVVRNCRVLCRRNDILLTTVSIFNLVFRSVYIVAKSTCKLRHARRSVCLSVSVSMSVSVSVSVSVLVSVSASVLVSVSAFSCINAAPTGRISMKTSMDDFYENLSRNSKFG
jgi:hypothetical protein